MKISSNMSQINQDITDAASNVGSKKETKMKQEGEVACQEHVKRRRRRNIRKEMTSDTGNNLGLKQDKLERKHANREQGEKRREQTKNNGKEQNRRYGMVVEDIYIDLEDIVDDIKQGKLSIEALPKMGLFPLHEAAARGLTKCAESLIELGLQLTNETPDGFTPLEVAVMAGNFDAAALLIQYGAPIDRIRDGIPQFAR